MKEQILKLRAEGKTYNQIKTILGCAKSLISYYCGDNQKEKTKQRTQSYRTSDLLSKKLDNFKSKKKLDTGVKDFQRSSERSFTSQDVKEKFGDNPKCYLTGRPISWEDASTFSFDHITPIYLNGDNSLENLGLTCPEANYAKHKLSKEEFIQLCKEILEHQGFSVYMAEDEVIETPHP